jgi:mono/diheme cytochrome c family protein
MQNLLKSLLLCAVALLVGCNKGVNSTMPNANTAALKKEVFSITTGRDTTLKTSAGVIIYIKAKSFLVAPNTKTQVTIQTIMTKADLIRSRVSTITADGKLLASGGMFNITTEGNLPINPAEPLQISLPTRQFEGKMQVFTADDDRLLWDNPSPLQIKTLLNEANGKTLFMEKCASCHNPNLKDRSTGPALACLDENDYYGRSRKWSAQMIRNSATLISAGDTLANCSFDFYNKSNMTAFPNLSDQEIDAILNYLQNESTRKGLCNKGYNFGRVSKTDCKTDPKRYRNDSIFWVQSKDTITIPAGYYTVFLNKYKWINCDYFVENTTAVDDFNVKINGADHVCLVFEKRMVSLYLYYVKNKIHSFYGNDIPLNLPLNEAVTIIGFTNEKNGKIKFGSIRTTIQNQNKHTLQLKEGTVKEWTDFIAKIR